MYYVWMDAIASNFFQFFPTFLHCLALLVFQFSIFNLGAVFRATWGFYWDTTQTSFQICSRKQSQFHLKCLLALVKQSSEQGPSYSTSWQQARSKQRRAASFKGRKNDASKSQNMIVSYRRDWNITILVLPVFYIPYVSNVKIY